MALAASIGAVGNPPRLGFLLFAAPNPLLGVLGVLVPFAGNCGRAQPDSNGNSFVGVVPVDFVPLDGGMISVAIAMTRNTTSGSFQFGGQLLVAFLPVDGFPMDHRPDTFPGAARLVLVKQQKS